MVEHGANVTLQNEDGHTALHKAVTNGHLEVVRFLVTRCKDVIGLCDKKGKRAVDYARDETMLSLF